MSILFLFIIACILGYCESSKVNYYLTNQKVTHLKFEGSKARKWFNSIDKTCSTVFLIHGWLPIAELKATTYFQETASEYMKVPPSDGCYNIVTVSWIASGSWNYFQAATKATTVVSKHIINFITKLHLLNLLHPRLDCTGHSLGAHICGSVGRGLTIKPFQVVTGLDPAGPSFTSALFVQNRSEYKLSIGDGVLVASLMTNAGMAGTSDYLGDINFIANGGTKQPGCPFLLDCNHLRAIILYEEAVLNGNLIGHSTNGTNAVFGRYMSMDTLPGIYELETGGKSPFSEVIK